MTDGEAGMDSRLRGNDGGSRGGNDGGSRGGNPGDHAVDSRLRGNDEGSRGGNDDFGGRPIPLLGLPGNPVSAMVAFEVFARPAILTMLGRRNLARPVVEGVLTAPIHNYDGRRVYARVQVARRDGTYIATPTGPQGSNILTSMAQANGLAICPEDVASKETGEQVKLIMLDWNEEVDV